ncbi:MAG: site-2 protease family protein [Synechococcales bacterium]|nr:site-2 protease family protein [Synechococcales bacterium]
MITILILLVALGLLAWGFYRAIPYGRLGVLSWLQSLVLMVPWLVFFGLSAAGIFLNLAGVLLLLLISTGIYIYLGRMLRAAGEALGKSNSNSAWQPLSSTQKIENETAAVDSDATRAASISSSEGSTTPETGSTTQGELPDRPNGVGWRKGAPLLVPIADEDLNAIRGIFGIDTFFATEAVPYQDGAIFKGNLRGDPDITYKKLSAHLVEKMGDRYRLYLLESPEGKPIVVVLPTQSDPKPSTPWQWAFAGVLLLATVATSLETAGILQGFDFFGEPQRLQEALPIALGFFGVLTFHEIGHWLSAQRHQVRLSPPFFIPTWQIGSFGALTRIESVLPNRSVLFDIAFAGPAAGGIFSLALLLSGLLLSHQGSLFQVPTEFFQGSILVGTLARVVLGNALQQPLVDIHPLTIVGWLGLVVTAINLMPAGQLDGGRVVQSIYGRKVARRATITTLIVLAVATLANPLALYWAIVILFLQRDLERPSLNELTEPDDARAALGLLALFLMAATLLPLTPGLAGQLGIGG